MSKSILDRMKSAADRAKKTKTKIDEIQKKRQAKKKLKLEEKIRLKTKERKLKKKELKQKLEIKKLEAKLKKIQKEEREEKLDKAKELYNIVMYGSKKKPRKRRK